MAVVRCPATDRESGPAPNWSIIQTPDDATKKAALWPAQSPAEHCLAGKRSRCCEGSQASGVALPAQQYNRLCSRVPFSPALAANTCGSGPPGRARRGLNCQSPPQAA
jgi:hypothetical protein